MAPAVHQRLGGKPMPADSPQTFFVGQGIEHYNHLSKKIRQRNEKNLFWKVLGDQMTRDFCVLDSCPIKIPIKVLALENPRLISSSVEERHGDLQVFFQSSPCGEQLLDRI